MDGEGSPWHINDAERIFTYRALRIARGDQTPLAGFEQRISSGTEDSANGLSRILRRNLGLVRNASVALFRSLAGGRLPRRASRARRK